MPAANGTLGERLPLYALCALMLVAFLLGGGSRDDIQSLIVLRPLAALFLAFGLVTIRREHLRRHRGAFALLGLLVLINVVQLIPLPPQLWTSLPGRDIVVQGAAAAGVEQVWRPISLVPFRTWNSLFALMIPFAGLLLAAQCNQASDFRVILRLLVGLACLSAVVGALQILAPFDSALYYYRITNNGLAVGLFANRNHNAAFVALAIPIAAFLLRPTEEAQGQRPVYKAALVAALIMLPPFVLLTGSRAGLGLMLIGLVSVPFFAGMGTIRSMLTKKAFWVPPLVVIVMLLALAVLSPAGVVRRIAESDFVDIRAQAWPVVWDLWQRYFPVGTGFGTLPEVYWVSEPDSQIREAYLNHAHNDWLELLLESGAAGLVLLLAAAVLWLRNFFSALRLTDPDAARRRLGLLVLAMLALASLFDYPLRVPSLALTLMIAGCMAARPLASQMQWDRSNALA